VMKHSDGGEGFFVRLSTELRDDGVLARLRGPALAVFIALGLHVGRDSRCWPGMSRLATLTGYDRSTVCRAVGGLEHLGLISVERHPGATNVYTIRRFFRFGKHAPTDGGDDALL